jgi:hypothetical protein
MSTTSFLLIAAVCVALIGMPTVALYLQSPRTFLHVDSAARCVSAFLVFGMVVAWDASQIVPSPVVLKQLGTTDRSVFAGGAALLSGVFSSMPAFLPRDVLSTAGRMRASILGSICMTFALFMLAISVSRAGHGNGAPFLGLAETLVSLVPPDQADCVPWPAAVTDAHGSAIEMTQYYGRYVIQLFGLFFRTLALITLWFAASEPSC